MARASERVNPVSLFKTLRFRDVRVVEKFLPCESANGMASCAAPPHRLECLLSVRHRVTREK